MEGAHGRETRTKMRLERKLVRYSVAAGATLAMAGPANAVVHYSGPKDIPVNADNPVVPVDIDGGGGPDFAFIHLPYYSNSVAATTITSLRGVWIVGDTSGNYAIGEPLQLTAKTKKLGQVIVNEPYRLPTDNIISADAPGEWGIIGILNEIKYGGMEAQSDTGGTYTYGNFQGQRGYIGVKFDIAGKTHYGWIEYEGTGAVPPGSGLGQLEDSFEGRILGWAYEDVAEKAIKAGDMGEPEAVPTLNQWGLMFLMGLILMLGARKALGTRREEE